MNDLLKSINLRLNNPFILSFIISWIFWNWPIVVGLLWYNARTLQLYGYPNYKALIMDNADVWKNYILPLCFAIAYPYLKLAFSALQTTVNAIDERTTKRLSGKGYIPTQKFLDLREQYETNIQKLSDVISKESGEVSENMTLKTKLTELNVQVTSLQNELKKKNDQLLSLQKEKTLSPQNLKSNAILKNRITGSLDVVLKGEGSEDFNRLVIRELEGLLKENGILGANLILIGNNRMRVHFTVDNVFESVVKDTINRALLQHPLVEEVQNLSFNVIKF